MSSVASRIQTRRNSRIGLRLSSIPLTFTRSSAAYLDGTSYPAHTPRYPSNSGVMGVLVEESHTNLALYSNEISNAYWTLNAVTVQADVGTAPDGTLTADKLVEQGGAATVHFFRRAVLTADSVNTVLLYAKAAGRNWLAIEVGAGYAYFDIANGVLGAKEASATASIKPVGNGWYQCAITYTIAAAGNINLTVDLANGNGGNSYAGDGASGILFWGVNATTKAYPLSEVMTTSATATMAAETLTMPTAGLLTPSSGSVIIKARYDGDNIKASPAGDHTLVTLGPASSANTVGLLRNSGGFLAAQTVSAGGAASNAQAAFAPSVGDYIAGMRWSAAELSVWQTGLKHATQATPNLPTTLAANINIGSQPNGTGAWNNPVYWVYFYDYALSDAEMAAATSGNPPPGFTAYVRFTNGKMDVIQGHAWGASELTQFLDGAHAN